MNNFGAGLSIITQQYAKITQQYAELLNSMQISESSCILFSDLPTSGPTTEDYIV